MSGAANDLDGAAFHERADLLAKLHFGQAIDRVRDMEEPGRSAVTQQAILRLLAMLDRRTARDVVRVLAAATLRGRF